jgi:hypothetical protein
MRVAWVHEAIKEGAGVLEKSDRSQGRLEKNIGDHVPATYVVLDESIWTRSAPIRRECGDATKCAWDVSNHRGAKTSASLLWPAAPVPAVQTSAKHLLVDTRPAAPEARRVFARLPAASVRPSNDFEQMSVEVFEVHAAAAVAAVDFGNAVPARVGPVLEPSFADAVEDLVEVVFAD